VLCDELWNPDEEVLGAANSQQIAVSVVDAGTLRCRNEARCKNVEFILN
jgi:hypothetical protein